MIYEAGSGRNEDVSRTDLGTTIQATPATCRYALKHNRDQEGNNADISSTRASRSRGSWNVAGDAAHFRRKPSVHRFCANSGFEQVELSEHAEAVANGPGSTNEAAQKDAMAGEQIDQKSSGFAPGWIQSGFRYVSPRNLHRQFSGGSAGLGRFPKNT